MCACIKGYKMYAGMVLSFITVNLYLVSVVVVHRCIGCMTVTVNCKAGTMPGR